MTYTVSSGTLNSTIPYHTDGVARGGKGKGGRQGRGKGREGGRGRDRGGKEGRNGGGGEGRGGHSTCALPI